MLEWPYTVGGGGVPHCTAPHRTALHCTALHCTALHCTALHCTAPGSCTALHAPQLARNEVQIQDLESERLELFAAKEMLKKLENVNKEKQTLAQDLRHTQVGGACRGRGRGRGDTALGHT